MKTTKRFIAMAAALTLTACTAIPMASFAAPQTVNVSVSTDGTKTNNDGSTPDKDAVTHTYTAYEIFKGEYKKTAGADTDTTDDDTYEFQVTDLGAGMNWSATDGLLKPDSDFMKLKPDGTKSIADVLTTLGSDATNAAKAKAIAQAIGDISSSSTAADALAKIFYANKSSTGTAVEATGTDLTEGYYLVADTYTPENGKSDAVSKFILQVAQKTGDDGIVIVPKKSYPTVEKKVKEDDKTVTGKPINDPSTTEKWNDVADYDIGEAVPFKLYGTMPETLGDYAHYYYKFTDTLGSQFDQPESIKIKIEGTTLTATKGATGYTVTGDTGTNCRVEWVEGDRQLIISFEDIKAYADVDKDTVVTVEYDAVLNDTANIGLPGQINAVKITYSNNPNVTYNPKTEDDKPDVPKDDNGTPDTPGDDHDATDDTPEDKVIVFTYELDVTKIDGTTKEKLANAEFTLKKGSKFAKVDSNGIFLKWVDAVETDAAGTTTLKSDANGQFKVSGIDDGEYTLTETKQPTGYNLLSEPITVTLKATTKNDQAWDDFDATKALTKLELNNTVQDEGTDNGKRGHAATTIENNKGTTLPTTGGIGTTLFILGGGCAAGIAGIYLVSKKKTREEE